MNTCGLRAAPSMAVACYNIPMPLSRYFRFRLRTLLVAIAIMSPVLAWVAHSLNWIRERHAMLNGEWNDSDMPPATLAPGGLWLLGEQGWPRVFVQRQRVDEARLLFPEAIVQASKHARESPP